MVRNLPSPAVAHAIGRNLVYLRNSVRSFLSYDLGAVVGKFRYYSVEELAQLATAVFLADLGMKPGAAFAIARLHAAQIRQCVSASGASGILTVTIDPKRTTGYITSFSPSPSPNIETADSVRAVLIVNVPVLAREAMARLAEFAGTGTAAA